MRELERQPAEPPYARPSDARADAALADLRIAVIGAGRLGTALTAALRALDLEVAGPLGRGARAAGADVALLCVPDAQITAAAAHVRPGAVVGHCSGAWGAAVLGEREAFALHPLMTFAGADTPAAQSPFAGADTPAAESPFAGCGCAIDGTTPHASELARALAVALGMRPFRVAASERAAYHAAASMASNFLIALEGAAERLAAAAGVQRDALIPLVRQTITNWEQLGAERALTGPIARGDEATVARQRAAIAGCEPELLELFDALVAATRALARPAASPVGAAA